MSHVSSQVVKGYDKVHPVVLTEGVKVAAQMLALQGQQVTEFVYDWNWNQLREWKGLKVICGLGAEQGKFRGVGLAVDKDGKFQLVGDFYGMGNHLKDIQKAVEKVLGGACYFAARVLIAQAKGQKTEVRVNAQTKQLQLVVQM